MSVVEYVIRFVHIIFIAAWRAKEAESAAMKSNTLALIVFVLLTFFALSSSVQAVRANLTGANLTRANLTGANLTNALGVDAPSATATSITHAQLASVRQLPSPPPSPPVGELSQKV